MEIEASRLEHLVRAGLLSQPDWRERRDCHCKHQAKLSHWSPSGTSIAVQAAWAGISMEQLLEELRQIHEFVLLYPPQGDKGPNRVATVLSKQTLPQQALAKMLGLKQLRITPRAQYNGRLATRSEDNYLYFCSGPSQ